MTHPDSAGRGLLGWTIAASATSAVLAVLWVVDIAHPAFALPTGLDILLATATVTFWMIAAVTWAVARIEHILAGQYAEGYVDGARARTASSGPGLRSVQ